MKYLRKFNEASKSANDYKTEKEWKRKRLTIG